MEAKHRKQINQFAIGITIAVIAGFAVSALDFFGFYGEEEEEAPMPNLAAESLSEKIEECRSANWSEENCISELTNSFIDTMAPKEVRHLERIQEYTVCLEEDTKKWIRDNPDSYTLEDATRISRKCNEKTNTGALIL